MRVILKKDLKDIGRVGEIVTVADGHGRNFLLARGYAVAASAEAVRQIEQRQEQERRRAEKGSQHLAKIAKKLSGAVFTLPAAAGDKGQLYSGLKEKEILLNMKKDWPDLPKEAKILDYKPVKATGEYSFILRLGADLKIPIKLLVVNASN